MAKKPRRGGRPRGWRKRAPRTPHRRIELHELVHDRAVLCRAIARSAKIPRARAEGLFARADAASMRLGDFVRGLLEPAARALGLGTAVALLETEDLARQQQRCQLLAGLDAETLPVCRIRDLSGWQEREDDGGVREVPGYGMTKFAPRGPHLVQGHLDHLAGWYRQQHGHLVVTGHGDRDFARCPWLNRMLGRLCPDIGRRSIQHALRERLLGFRIRAVETLAEELRKGKQGEPRRKVVDVLKDDPVRADLDELLEYDREEFDRDEPGRRPDDLPGYGGAITNLATVVAYLEHELRMGRMDPVARNLRVVAGAEADRLAASKGGTPGDFFVTWRDPLRDPGGTLSYFVAWGKPWRAHLDEALDGFGEALDAARVIGPGEVLRTFLSAGGVTAGPKLSRSAARVWEFVKGKPALPTYEVITGELQMARGTVSKALKELRSKGHIAGKPK